ncbi:MULTISPECIES: helix-turn-helix transcriptional regulator [unclassified Dehalobacter]|uniref:helix-turn-helix domain-containing protein n=1 Tax=unclassified Dehalobacter TaxID=2635733 RepID=UPI000E6D0FDF|nr:MULTISPECIES: helix-turn-helix transcriptional regulator [unclassified Dehalobacter]RJE47190.1 transcriptional regulator [Dehalobacter sp. MCB1]TCX53647.1 XRE family transcriptional regulator [Dehalobacter sp. 14DCB1]TCX54950.1 XRE family transcriptional regulator [Dehalobacter sp. 12DCB1]
MVRIKLSELLGKHKMNQKTLASLTGIRPATISKMYYEETKRIEIDQINQICDVFQCRIEDLLEYVPDNKAETSINK